MTRLLLLSILALAACDSRTAEPVNATEAQRQADAPVKDVDVIPADENAAAAVGEGDGAPLR
jgi:PBP1b-binding outer membrane lipoprotein LpoB